MREDTSNTKNNPSIQQKEHKKFAFIMGDSMVKDIDGYLFTGSIKIKFIVCEGVSAFFIGQNGGHAGLY